LLDAWGNLPHLALLALPTLAILLLFAMLAHHFFRPLPALGNRSSASLAFLDLAPLIFGLALLLSRAHLPVAILPHSIGQCAPVEYRGLRGRRGCVDRPLYARPAIWPITE
jgi:hypothetical protein